MNLRAINDLLADPRACIDDRVVNRDDVSFDAFILGDKMWHEELAPKQKVTVGNRQLNCHSSAVSLDGQRLRVNTGADYRAGQKVYLVPHDQLKIYMTNLPTQTVLLGNGYGDIQFETAAFCQLKRDGQNYHLHAFANGAPLYWKGRPADQVDDHFEVGDRLYVDGLLIERRERQLKLTPLRADVKLNISKLLPDHLIPEYPADFPNFRRSPRIYLRQPTERLQLENVPTKQAAPWGSIMQMMVPPIGMVVASGLVSILSGGSGMIMMGMGSVSVLTAAFSVSSYFGNKREIRDKNKKNQQAYDSYLLDLTGKLDILNHEQRQVLKYNYPSMNELSLMMKHYDSRLYERTFANDDFLTVSLGSGQLPISYQFVHDNRKSKAQTDYEKFIDQNVIKKYSQVKAVPITIPLRQTTLGLAGGKRALRQAVSTILFQIAAFHSYHDVQFIAILSEEEYEKHWKEWRWLPHFQIESLNLRGLVYNAQTRDMVLNSLYQLLAKRRQDVREQRQSHQQLQFKPYLVLYIEDESWLNGHSLNEFLMEDMSQYGVTVIWAKDTTAMLPETITTLVDYRSTKLGTVVNKDREYLDLNFTPNAYPTVYPLEAAIKRLANLNHVEVEKNSIPDSITFLQLYHVKNVAQLKIRQRWAKADTSKTLAVPLGVRGKDDVVDLNLHERAHGPHGLIAGTTGSGKSELLQSYILSLAVNFAPEDVGFLPIDYKGGGMANLFNKLPHLMGSITNLDGAGTERALKSIHAELTKRQRWFSKYHVNNINLYTELYKKGKTVTDPQEKKKYPSQPLPHLFLISDEFAELKANEPDFMDELVSTARIGRSLGVHLILATQKPSGVVNDQIWSNSHFKIALKVSEPADSKEIIRTPDAATITQPGRAYLQVGNNEIYELFQSAYSGAAYHPDQEESHQADNRIWLVNHLGQAELLTRDLSESTEASQSEEDETELEAVVDEVAKETKAAHAVIPMKPWLPPLKEVIHGPAIDWQKQWQADRTLKAPFGMLDIPSHQEQKPMEFDLEEFNPALIVGSAGYGKSMALQTLITNLAKENSPAQMQFYLLDFGTNGLLPLTKLPHVADIASFANMEKLRKMLKRLSALVDDRKALLQEQGVSTLGQYEDLVHKHLPVIVVALDAYDTVAEDDDHRDAVDLVITKLLREGQALGIYMIITANRFSSFRLSVTSNITKKIGLYMVDETAPRDMLGRKVLKQSSIPGRGQMEIGDEMLAFQVYTPTPHDDSLQIINDLRDLSEQMDQSWNGDRPKKIPMLPPKIDDEMFSANNDVQHAWQNYQLPLGFATETTKPVIFDFKRDGYLLLLFNTGRQQKGLQRAVSIGLQQMKGQLTSILINLTNADDEFANVFTSVVQDQGTNVADQFADIKDEVEEREVDGGGKPMLVYVLGAQQLGNKLMDSEDDFNEFLNRAKSVNIFFIFDAPEKQLFTQYSGVVKAIRDDIPLGTIGTRFRDQSSLDINSSFREPRLKDNEVNVFRGQNGLRMEIID